jgi:hypothetical protein
VRHRAFATRFLLGLVLACPAAAQSPAEPPERQRAFCQRVAAAALRCEAGGDLVALSACLVRTLPWQDSLRVALVAAAARADMAALLAECRVR